MVIVQPVWSRVIPTVCLHSNQHSVVDKLTGIHLDSLLLTFTCSMTLPKDSSLSLLFRWVALKGLLSINPRNWCFSQCIVAVVSLAMMLLNNNRSRAKVYQMNAKNAARTESMPTWGHQFSSWAATKPVPTVKRVCMPEQNLHNLHIASGKHPRCIIPSQTEADVASKFFTCCRYTSSSSA